MLDLYERETDEALARAPRSAVPEVGVFDGFLRGTGLATVRQLAVKGFATPLQQIGAIGAIAYDRTVDNWYGTNSIADGTSAQDRYFRTTDEWIQSAIDRWTPKPYEVGIAGEIAGTLLGLLPLAIASPPTAVAGLQLDTAAELARKGVGDWRAQAVAAAQATGFGVGIWMPFLGSNLWQRMAVGGAGANVLQGVVMRGSAEEILRGHPAAEAFKALDPVEITLDTILGLAFGAAAHYIPSWRAQSDEASRRFRIWAQNITPQELAAVAALRQAQHSNQDSLPGKPVAPADLEAHVTRLKAALDQLERGETRVEVQGIGRPVEDAQATPAEAMETPGTSDVPVSRDGAAPEVVAEGAYRDGGNWRARYSTEKRTDGTFALVRTITDSDGEQTAHLTKDGEWRKGRPAKTAAMGAHAEETGAESFPTPEYAMAAANDDASSMGAARAVEAQDAAAAAVAETRETGPTFEPDPARLQEMARRAEELVAEAGRIRAEEQLRVELPTDPAPPVVPEAARSPFLPEGVEAMAHPQQARRIAEAIEARLREVGDPPERARANAAIWEARMRTRAERYGQSPAEWMRSLGLEIESGQPDRPGSLNQQPKFTNTPEGPVLESPDVNIRDPWGFTKDGEDSIVQHQLYDRDGKPMGSVSLGWRDGQVTQLLNIESVPQRAGMGEKVLRTILSHNKPETELFVRYIQPEAVEFWRKMGVRFDQEGTDGILTRALYEQARSKIFTQPGAGAGLEGVPADAARQDAGRGARSQEELGLGRSDQAVREESPRTLEQRPGPRWVSELSRQIEAAKMTQAPAKGWKDFLRGLKGVKADEIKWSGIEEWLDLQQGKITKDQVLAFLRENGVRVEEVMLGTEPADAARVQMQQVLAREGYRVEYNDPMGDGEAVFYGPDDTPVHFEELPDNLQAEVNRASAAGDNDSARPSPKYGQYQLPGAKQGSYRELLLTLPSKLKPEDRGTAYERETGNDFRSSHFDEPNILAHVRFNERTDASGRRGGFIEEIQSDWAQKGKKEGFADPTRLQAVKAERQAARIEADALVDAARAAVRPYIERAQQLIDNGADRALHDITIFHANGRNWRIEWGITDNAAAEAITKYVEAQIRQDVAEANYDALSKPSRIPAAPFVGKTEAWVGLVLKRMIRYAAENGWEWIAWTRGEQQVERYTNALRKAVDTIEWTKTPEGVQLVGYKGTRGQAEIDPDVRRAARDALDRNDNLGFDTQNEALQAIWTHADWADRWEVANEADAQALRRYVIARRNAMNTTAKNKVVDTTEREDALSDAIGKAMADRILNDPAQSGTIEGENIKVDDTGMATFYDRIVHNVAKDVLKKLGGGRVGEVRLGKSTGEKLNRKEIADAAVAYMRGDSTPEEFLENSRLEGLVTADEVDEAIGGFGRDPGDRQRARDVAQAYAAAMADKFAGQKATKQPAIDLAPELRERALQGMTLFQPAKGQITFADGRTIIDLFETADASTFQHETGHLFLQDIRDVAMGQNAPRQALEDWAVLANWLGNEGGDITRAQHEQFARGWERYLAEGISPSVELRPIFEQFKEWLLAIYRKLRGLDVELSPEVRGLFDRMLATDAEIAQARTETDGPPAQRAATVEPPPPPGEAGAEAGPARPEVLPDGPEQPKEAGMTMKQLREASKAGPFNLRRAEAKAEIERREKAGEAAFGREVAEMTDAQLKKVVDGGRKFRKSLREQALAEMKLRADKEAALAKDMADPETRAEVERLGAEAGWAQVGGKLADERMRGKVAISKWIPRAEWWTRRPEDMNEAATKETVRKMLAGEPLRAAEKRMAVFLVDEAKAVLEHFRSVPEPEAKAIETDWATLDPGTPASPKDVVDADLVAAAADLAEGRVERAAQVYENDDAGFMAEIRRILDEHAQDQATPRSGEEGQPAPQDEANALIHAYDRAQREAELAGDRDAGQQDRPLEEGEEAAPDPLSAAAHDIVAQNPNRLVRVGTTPEGEPMLITIDEYLRGELDAATAAREDIALFEAAASCLLGRGEG